MIRKNKSRVVYLGSDKIDLLYALLAELEAIDADNLMVFYLRVFKLPVIEDDNTDNDDSSLVPDDYWESEDYTDDVNQLTNELNKLSSSDTMFECREKIYGYWEKSITA